ncbi:hypothetical protein [Acinetobacter baumannii]|uniref:hypothetical protein n=1 Tax=Acinetobacter baumannii TaxID=470 RepID=UPI00111FC263|nr:hypothetical protein [Acinetobacter baumannii]KAF0598731.1 hypothetical protein AB71190_03629 [Acinetobacter baumannii]MBD0229055.1 hypothetical protein [Acinetobacter baumannii]MBL4060745.1 hypothetical protein [Acinetobacter baumannii]MBP4148665.1 hypothetical protein [Acinetobacter baumannii]MBP4156229.1 hypothetical protein [Acinetobacter baumannii]
MSDEYPKMLYKGDLIKFEFTTAVSEEHEEELKADGWVEHHELEEPVNIDDANDPGDGIQEIDLDAYVSVEQFDALAEKLTEAESKLDEKTIELEKAQEQLTTSAEQHATVVSNLEGEINRLKEELKAAPAEAGVPQEVYDAVYQEREQLLKENAQYKYSAMGANDLRAILDEKGIKYGSRDEKPALVKLVLENQ